MTNNWRLNTKNVTGQTPRGVEDILVPNVKGTPEIAEYGYCNNDPGALAYCCDSRYPNGDFNADGVGNCEKATLQPSLTCNLPKPT